MTNKEFFQQCWNAELKSTLIALEALIPVADKLDYKPAEKNRSAKQLVDHFASHVLDLVEAAETGVLNHRLGNSFPSIDEAISSFRQGTDRLMELLNKTDDNTWDTRPIPLMIYGNKVGEYPLAQTCWMFMFDIIHHRGQLSTYYRPMGAVQPPIYGPTAEMVEEMMAKNN